MAILDTIQSLKNEWSTPHFTSRDPMHEGFALCCRFSQSGTVETAVYDAIKRLPKDPREFWQYSSEATLFEDVSSGQWGLHVLTPQCAVEETLIQRHDRPNDFGLFDLVIGRFLGDSERLVLRCDDTRSDFGHVLVSLPLDHYKDWYQVAHSFTDLLQQYADHEGDKFWEVGL